jgi:sodium-dependent phosphate transporter
MLFPWIVISGGIYAFIATMGIGANDVANAFATSVGSGALTLKSAIITAAVFEASGAILMGSHVTNTIRKGIADYECFEDQPGVLMYGCMWVVFSVGSWLFLATKYELPVSTTHSCVGGMIGMTIATAGTQCVKWYEAKDTFPYVGGVSGIVLSWFISPIFSAAISSSLFCSIRCLVLRKENSFSRTFYIFPGLVGFTLVINAFFIIYKGGKGLGWAETPLTDAVMWAFVCGTCGAIIIIPFMKKTKSYVEKEIENRNIDDYEREREVSLSVTDIDKNEYSEIHDNAEVFDEKTEGMFKTLQVFTAICGSFAHGANDVANGIGPFVAIYTIGKTGEVNEKNEMGNDSLYILIAGGLGISLGLALYGYKIIKALGLKLCKITPSRGTCIELGSAIVIITGSWLEIPLSTTHCQVGATCGVAALENKNQSLSTLEFRGINKKLFLKIVFGWVITCIIVGTMSGLLSAQGVYAPCIRIYNN